MGVDSISELAQILPQIIIYIVTGYVFKKHSSEIPLALADGMNGEM